MGSGGTSAPGQDANAESDQLGANFAGLANDLLRPFRIEETEVFGDEGKAVDLIGGSDRYLEKTGDPT